MPDEVTAQRVLRSAKHFAWTLDPVQWAEDRLSVPRETLEWSALSAYADHTWDGDKDVLARVLRNVARFKWTAVESATSTGKTYCAAIALLYFLERFEGSFVVTLAPKSDQLRLNLWKEVQSLYPKFGRGELQTMHLRMEPPMDKWHAIGFVAGVSADEAESSARRAQGFHAPNMLIIAEECPGIHPAVLSAFENTATGEHNVILAIGNPDSEQDTLHSFSLHSHVEHMRISAFDHPNVVMNNPEFIPGAQTRLGIERLRAKYGGESHRMFQSRARGICPSESTDSLIRWDWCRQAATRKPKEGGVRALGVDVANSVDGDKAAIADGKGSTLLKVDDFPCENSNLLGEQVHIRATATHVADREIGVDGIGVGAGTVNELKRLGRNVKDIQSAAKADVMYSEHGDRMAEKFKDKRSQMWWLMRLDLQFGEVSGIVLPEDPELFADLCTPRFTTKNGMIVVEPKEAIRKRLGRSPNKGDAAVYWNYVRYRRTGIPVTTDDVEPEAEVRGVASVRTNELGSERIRNW